MDNIFKFREHVQQSSMHWTEASVEPFLGDWLVVEVKVECVSVICNEITLQPVIKPLKLSTESIVITLSLHLARLLFDREIIS